VLGGIGPLAAMWYEKSNFTVVLVRLILSNRVVCEAVLARVPRIEGVEALALGIGSGISGMICKSSQRGCSSHV
jgi:hypothetical protein